MGTEEWCRVEGHPAYEVSDCGRIRNQAGRVLRPTKAGHGYRQVALTRGTKALVHTLVLEAFVGPRPLGLQCRHLNGRPDDNRLSNLRWGTQAENDADRTIHGTENIGSRNPRAKLTEDQARVILTSAEPASDLASRYGVGRGQIYRIRSGAQWRSLTQAEGAR